MLEVNREFALKFVAEKHRGKLRIGGDENITHLMSVAEIVRQCGAAVSVRTD